MPTQDANASLLTEQRGLTRRELVAKGALGIGTFSAAAVIAACGSSSAPSASSHATSNTAGLQTTTGGGTPVRGGTLRIGMISGGTLETITPLTALSSVDVVRRLQIYDQLFAPSEDLKSYVPALAVSAEPNKDASVWTVQLRPRCEVA